jgi:hypothetical protein
MSHVTHSTNQDRHHGSRQWNQALVLRNAGSDNESAQRWFALLQLEFQAVV